MAVRTALWAHTEVGPVLLIVLGGVLSVFALCWLHFAQDVPRRLVPLTTAMIWGYGHYAVFAAAAVGASLIVDVAHTTRHGTLTDAQAAAAYTVPAALFVVCVWLLHRRVARPHTAADVLPVGTALAVLAGTFTPVLSTGIVTSLFPGASLVAARKELHGIP